MKRPLNVLVSFPKILCFNEAKILLYQDCLSSPLNHACGTLHNAHHSLFKLCIYLFFLPHPLHPPLFKVDCSRFNIMLISTLSYLIYMFIIIVLAFFPVTFLSIKSWLGKTSSQKYRPSFLKNHHYLFPGNLTCF